MEMRLMKALALLRDPESRIYNVAKQCGFSHMGLFHACFKKRFGKTPGECRTAAAHPEATHKRFNRADYEFYQSL
jgi:transcriptional regulator GlxA family with amidase domain